MSKLAEIEAAADALPVEQKQELMLFLARQLRAQGKLPEPRQFTREQIQSWIDEDESAMRRFRTIQTPRLGGSRLHK